jgi:hypothetical protein
VPGHPNLLPDLPSENFRPGLRGGGEAWREEVDTAAITSSRATRGCVVEAERVDAR